MSIYSVPQYQQQPQQASTLCNRKRHSTNKARRHRSVYSLQPDIAERESSLYFYSTSSYSTHRLSDTYSSDEEIGLGIPQLPLSKCLSEPDDLKYNIQSSLDLTTCLMIQDRYIMGVSEGEILAREVGRMQLRSAGLDFETENFNHNLKPRLSSAMAPIPPPRSTLRAPPPRAVSDPINRPTVSERLSSLYHLPVDQPLPQPGTPSLSSGSSHDGDAESPVTPSFPLASGSGTSGGYGSGLGTKRLSHTAEGLVTWGRRRKSGIERDEYKVKDGAVKRKASSGVYTPPTFPGPAGQQRPPLPTASSAVYTPKTFTLHPAQPYNSKSAHAIPTRSTSISSTDSSPSDNDFYPQTPVTPALPARLSVSLAGAGKSMSTFKRRISNQINSLEIRQPQPASSPSYSRESYFPQSPGEMEYTPAHSRKSSYGPVTPQRSGQYPIQLSHGSKGLGIGLLERDGQTTVPMPAAPIRNRSRTLSGMDTSLEIDESVKRDRGMKRKPVPKIIDHELEERLSRLEIETVGHAL